MDTKNIKEIIAGLKLLAVAGVKIGKDGKVNAADLPIIIGLLTNVNVIVDAVKDAGQVVPEAKDLDQAELLELGTLIYGVYQAIIAAKNEV